MKNFCLVAKVLNAQRHVTNVRISYCPVWGPLLITNSIDLQSVVSVNCSCWDCYSSLCIDAFTNGACFGGPYADKDEMCKGLQITLEHRS